MRTKMSLTFIGVLLSIFVLWDVIFSPASSSESKIAIVVHGGAGTIRKANMTEEMEKAYRAKLQEALQTGYEVLKNGGSSLDAVEKAIMVMEDSPLFNAGKGAVFTSAGTNELDASIMDGKTLNAGAVAAVKRVKNPIKLARLVMEKSPHVLLSGEGAETFAKEQGIELVDPKYFYTKRRWESLQRVKKREKESHKQSDVLEKNTIPSPDDAHKFGTVGVVALDKEGNLAAGTSTGGLTNKRFGRIGDSPIIGAGNYANNKTCAVSGTGHGEYFIRGVVAYDISALMEYKGMSLKEAAEHVVMKKLIDLGGSGGVIALDHDGNIAMPFNTEGMYRGYIDTNGKMVVKIYKDE
ncbi:MAG: isoaspartyl peptidase/L-asparaginase [Methanobacteriota archaeon]|nr:MAG: isoaspartyl peptidase/L-asparaginase [Euryarchaeota archaeon]